MGVRCVAVPVFDADHVFATALSATGTKGRLPLEDVERIAKEMTKVVQPILGIKA